MGGTDYSAPGKIVIPAGSLSRSTLIRTTLDILDEHDESVVVDIDAVTNGVEDGSQQVIMSILDDDPEPTVTLGIDTATILENGGVATLSATLSELSGRDVVVDLVYSGGGSGRRHGLQRSFPDSDSCGQLDREHDDYRRTGWVGRTR